MFTATPGRISPPRGPESVCEQLRRVFESLELKGIAAGIEEKHRRLLADLALEADVRGDDEPGAGGSEPVGELL